MELVRIAKDIIEGRVRPLVGAVQLCPHVHTLEREIDPQSGKLIVGVSSECDGLPLGHERQYWAAAALQQKDKLTDAYEASVRASIIETAQNLLDQFEIPG